MVKLEMLTLAQEVLGLPDHNSALEGDLIASYLATLSEAEKDDLRRLSIDPMFIRASRLMLLRKLGFTSSEAFLLRMHSLSNASVKKAIARRAYVARAQGLSISDLAHMDFYELNKLELEVIGSLSEDHIMQEVLSE